jgi:hypothetical protein
MTEVKTPIRHHKKPGMARRLAYGSILNRVVLLNRAAMIQQTAGYRIDILNQTIKGALKRLKKQNPFMLTIPPKVEAARLASAMKSTMGE